VVHDDGCDAPRRLLGAILPLPPHRAARLLPSSTALKRRLLATTVPHKVDRGRRRCRVLGVSDVFVQVFHLDVAYVAMVIYACCKHIYHVASICLRCLKRMFQVFHRDLAEVYLDVA
jgi:hypothetical protein